MQTVTLVATPQPLSAVSLSDFPATIAGILLAGQEFKFIHNNGPDSERALSRVLNQCDAVFMGRLPELPQDWVGGAVRSGLLGWGEKRCRGRRARSMIVAGAPWAK